LALSGWRLAGKAGVDVPDRIDLHILQAFLQEVSADKLRPFRFVICWSRDLLDGNGEVKKTFY